MCHVLQKPINLWKQRIRRIMERVRRDLWVKQTLTERSVWSAALELNNLELHLSNPRSLLLESQHNTDILHFQDWNKTAALRWSCWSSGKESVRLYTGVWGTWMDFRQNKVGWRKRGNQKAGGGCAAVSVTKILCFRLIFQCAAFMADVKPPPPPCSISET